MITFPDLLKTLFICRLYYLVVCTINKEAVTQRCSVKKVFLEISQNSQENTCARVSFFIKLRGLGLQLY